MERFGFRSTVTVCSQLLGIVAVICWNSPPVLAQSPGKVYWTDIGTHKIQRANLDGSGVEDLVTSGITNPHGIALDPAGGKMYWADGQDRRIQRANLDGSNVQTLVSNLTAPIGIDLDRVNGKMYWTDIGSDNIKRANLDGSSVQTLIYTGPSAPFDIALDVANNKMYWADNDLSKIQCANMDGSGLQDLVTGSTAGNPRAIELDLANGKIYWIAYGAGEIRRANLDGSNVEDLITASWGSFTFPGIAVDPIARRILWTENATPRVRRSNLDGTSLQDLVTQGLINPSGLALLPTAACSYAASRALLFDGSNDLVRIPDSASLDLSTAATIEFWFAPQEYAGTDFQRIIEKGDGVDGNSDRAYEIEFHQSNASQPGIQCTFFLGTNTYAIGYVYQTLVPGAWIHVCSTFDLAAGEIRVYVNGVLKQIHSGITQPIRNSSYPLIFGAVPPFGRYYKGQLDEVRIWNVARSSAEVAANYSRLVSPNTPGIVGYWRFDEATGIQSVLDSSSLGNNGTLGASSSVASDDPTRVASTAPIYAANAGPDCNANGVPDSCDIADGNSQDCNANGIPDECELVGQDCNDNGIPDSCEQCGDFDSDGDVDGADFSTFLLAFGRTNGQTGFLACADFDHDGAVTLVDYQRWLACYRQFIGNPSAAPPRPTDQGDLNADGRVDGLDIQPFIDTILNPAFAGLRARMVADMNWDSQANADDVIGFVERLLAVE